MKLSEVLLAVWDITDREQKSLDQLVMKSQEELGELAQAVLSMEKAPGCAYKGKKRADVDEEAVDVILCAAAVLFFQQPRDEFELGKLFERKLQAWQAKIERERNNQPVDERIVRGQWCPCCKGLIVNTAAETCGTCHTKLVALVEKT